MASVTEVLAARKPRRVSVGLLLDGELAHELAEARRLLADTDRLDESLASPAAVLEARVRELEAQATAAQTVFTIKAVGRARMAEIKLAHPPSETQLQRWEQQAEHNPLAPPPEFDYVAAMPVLLSESLLEPTATPDEAEALWDTLSDGEAAKLAAVLWDVNMEASSVPLSAGSTGQSPNGVPTSTTAPR